jgi:hypothetical protein
MLECKVPQLLVIESWLAGQTEMPRRDQRLGTSGSTRSIPTFGPAAVAGMARPPSGCRPRKWLSSDICSTLTPVIAGTNFVTIERLEMAGKSPPVGGAERQLSITMTTFGGPSTAWREDQTIAVGLRSVVDDP